MKRARVASRVGLAVVLIAIACTESVGPERRNPGVPLFSYSANGITLDQQNGALGGNGQLLVKGFNPTNPHHGDAIIATFYWINPSGSTGNIIDSVRDVLTTAPTYTPVGNPYHLVEYVTAGGYSMATYVATNVQNFPDPNTDPNQGDIYAVAGYFSQKITDGGVSVSAWTGVEDNFAAALGEHRSASGSGPGGFEPVPAQAGPIAVNAGAVVTLSVVISDRATTFARWLGSCGGSQTTCTVTLDQSRSVLARFSPVRVYLPVDVNGGSVDVSPRGTSCGYGCTAVPYGTRLDIESTLGTGSRFSFGLPRLPDAPDALGHVADPFTTPVR